MNIQYAVKDDVIYVLEVNPRASRTVPFVSKATGVQWAKVAAKLMAGKTLKELGIEKELVPRHMAVKESVFPFNKFAGVDTILGPEMKSTGEVMGIDSTFGSAFWKSQLAAGQDLPSRGNVSLSVKNRDKRNVVFIAKKLSDLGFTIYATKGTGKVLANNGIDVTFINKVPRGQASRRRHDKERGHSIHNQHAQRKEPQDGRGGHPLRGRPVQDPLHDNTVGRPGRRQRHRSDAKRNPESKSLP